MRRTAARRPLFFCRSLSGLDLVRRFGAAVWVPAGSFLRSLVGYLVRRLGDALALVVGGDGLRDQLVERVDEGARLVGRLRDAVGLRQ